MQKIIGGRLFDTETAVLVGAHRGRRLYQTDAGFYFFLDEKTETITLCSYRQARRWAQMHLSQTVCCREFSVLPSMDLVVQLDRTAYKKLCSVCERKGIGAEALLNQLILMQLKNKKIT